MLELAAALAKFLLYAGALAAAGLTLAAASLNGRLGAVAGLAPGLIGRSASTALLAAIASFIILVIRLGGELNAPTLSAIAETPAGPAAVLQVAGASLILAFAGGRGAASILRLGGAAALLAAFGVNGHAASVNAATGVIVFIHVLAASWWIGSLVLLERACMRLPREQLDALVRRFSLIALGIVGGLLAAGVVVALALLDFGREDWLTPYAQALTLKILLAAFLLALAAWNKFRLTPQLKQDDGGGVRALHHSIGIEIGIVAGVLAATAWLTTFTSPHT